MYIYTSQLEGLQKFKSYRYTSSEKRSIFIASWWSKLSNVTGFFTACVGALSPAVELNNAIRFRL